MYLYSKFTRESTLEFISVKFYYCVYICLISANFVGTIYGGIFDINSVIIVAIKGVVI